MNMRIAGFLAGVSLVLAACGGDSDDGSGPSPAVPKKRGGAPEGLSNRPLKAEHRALVTRLADAVVRKDYKAAYEQTSQTYRKDLGWDEFLKSISRYRGAAVNPPTYGIWATEDDPKQIQKDSVVELFVPAPFRSRIVEEAAIHFDVKESDGTDGFWALICWIVEEDGAPRILNYYQDD
jgi:hypothetical protein